MRFLLSILILVALLGKGMIPAGYMVADRISGGFELTLCSSDGAVTVVIGADGLPIKDSPAQKSEPCPYFMIPFAVLAEAGPLLELHAELITTQDWQEGRNQIVVVSPPKENTARAPPITV